MNTQGLHAYGLLMGKAMGLRPQRGPEAHCVLFVQPGDHSHPPYRVAINLQTPKAPAAGVLQYQVVDLGKVASAAPLLDALRKRKSANSFLLADADPTLPRIDYVRGKEMLGLGDFVDVPVGSAPLLSAIEAAVASTGSNGGKVVVFGTGAPMNHRTGEAAPTGYTGVDNVHMNQGALHTVGGDLHFLENGPNQDGALLFLSGSSAKGVFLKFRGQSLSTDAQGNPTKTGVRELDRTPKPVREAILRPRAGSSSPKPASPSETPHPAGAPGAALAEPQAPSANGYVFADPNEADAQGKFVADDDGGTFKTPFVMNLSKGGTRGPVPAPRKYPTLDLASVLGQNPRGYVKTAQGESIAFDVVGDSGAPAQQKLPGELRVTELLARNAQESPPAFLFHVGDVVYFYGEGAYYYGQFFEPFREYPAPIFAIPGNHDGVTYSASMVSLEAFQKVFCATAPVRSDLAGGILRSTMTQPGVYFTLDAPLVSIIGLYSNCGESIGWLDEQQLLFLYQELSRLKDLRAKEGRAVILAIHHCPRWFPGQPKPDVTSEAIDRACAQAQFWPDAVISGHAHLYQRVVRQEGGRDIPYIITGAGGYGLDARQEVAKDYVAKLPSSLARLLVEEGHVRVTVTRPSNGSTPPTLRFEYHSTKQTSAQPDDVCVVNLKTNKLM